MPGAKKWNTTELIERVEYEAWALRFYLSRAFSPGGGSWGPIEIEVSDPNADIRKQPSTLSNFIETRLSDGAVMDALRHFVPLAFQAAFKAHDMFIEWILHANGCTAWQFVAKKTEYRERKTSGTLRLPDFLSSEPRIEQALFALYERLSARRNVLIHDASFELLADGTIRIFDDAGRFTDLPMHALRAYIETVLLSIDLVSGRSREALYDQDGLEAALDVLRPIHNAATPRRSIRWASIRLRYIGDAVQRTPTGHGVIVDLRGVRDTIAEWLPVPEGGQHRIRLEVEADVDGHRLSWTVEPSEVRGGNTITLDSDSPRCTKKALA